jgi:hypothetical protein
MLTTAHINLLRQAIDAAGATMPTKVAKALGDLDKLTSKGELFAQATDDQIAQALADALLAGRDPLDDDQLRRMATSRMLGGTNGRALAIQVARHAEQRVTAALIDHVDYILANLHDAADVAGQHLSAAHAVLGDVGLDESLKIIRQGDDASGAWARARDAVAQLRTIDKGWTALANLTRFASTSPTVPRLADLSLDQFEQLGLRPDGWAIVRAGATIDLADRQTIKDRARRLAAKRENRAALPAAQFKDNYRRSRGVSVA